MPSDATPNPTAPTLTFGQCVQRARERSGKTRAYVGDVMGHSVEWVRGIEKDRIGMPHLPKLLRLAHALGVDDITELLGDDRIAAATYSKAEHEKLPLLKRALTSYHLATPDGPPAPAEHLDARLRQAWKLWHAEGDHRTGIVELIPGLLADAQRSARLLEGADRRRALVSLAETYHLAQLYLSFQPAPDLVVLTGDRAMSAAQDADSPRAMAAAAWYVNHVHRDAGEAAEARVDLAEQAAALLPRDDDPDHIARRGLLYLAVALSYAKTGQGGDAQRYWDKADKAATQLGDDYTHPWLIFGRGIVDAYKITMHNDLVQPAQALEVANSLDLDLIPSATRRSYHLAETARAHDLLGEGAASVGYLRKAFEESRETLQYSLYARRALPGLAKSGPRMVQRDARELAVSLGVPV
ncbi:helix-turn-helix domain-containing protein [Streptomyces acidiscabies]|uniref:helix-turn-helix domain-containing protein n=1 Tax=Streptomyces acidiscabies TaxID=42234 RepID=UPI000952B1C7|nr:helix-turn-helix transcriptional regulator [Streptomyces acidiscabies]